MDKHNKRIMLLLTAHTYRGSAFAQAAERLGIEVIAAVDMPKALADYWDFSLGVRFSELETAVPTLVDFARQHPVAAVLAVDDSGSLLAAAVSKQLGLPHNDAAAATAARDKYEMRRMLQAGGAPVPPFQRFLSDMPIAEITAAVAANIGYPGVIKPLQLSGSRGVMRVNNEQELATAVRRLVDLLHTIQGQGRHPFLVEGFIPGVEIALEGLMEDGRLRPLAIFDKPDPLDGPFFEETIYVTPSRLAAPVQNTIVAAAQKAAAALGLRIGPVHAELRVNENGPWLVELAGRSIGGLCSQTLRFDEDMSLEELILRQACGLEIQSFARERQASGVMMIPIPEAGLLRGIAGVDAATAVSGIEEVNITAKMNYRLVPLPEGESYLGFIFARDDSPALVEAALRQAHGKLQFQIEPEIPLRLVSTHYT